MGGEVYYYRIVKIKTWDNWSFVAQDLSYSSSDFRVENLSYSVQHIYFWVEAIFNKQKRCYSHKCLWKVKLVCETSILCIIVRQYVKKYVLPWFLCFRVIISDYIVRVEFNDLLKRDKDYSRCFGMAFAENMLSKGHFINFHNTIWTNAAYIPSNYSNIKINKLTVVRKFKMIFYNIILEVISYRFEVLFE